MIQVKWTIGDTAFSKEFPSTVKGEKEAIELLGHIAKKRAEDPRCFNLKKIQEANYKRLSTFGNADYRLMQRIRKLERERDEFLKRFNYSAPEPIKVEIIHVCKP